MKQPKSALKTKSISQKSRKEIELEINKALFDIVNNPQSCAHTDEVSDLFRDAIKQYKNETNT